MGSSRASAGLQVFLAQQMPSLGCHHLLLPLGAPGPHLSPAVLALLLPVHPGPGRVADPAGLRGRGAPCPDKLELLQGEPRVREARNRSWVLGRRDPPASAWSEWGGRCRTKAPSQQHQGISPHGTSSLLSHPASGTAQQGDTDGEAGTEIQPPCAGTQSRDTEPGASLAQKLCTASAWCSQPRWGHLPLWMWLQENQSKPHSNHSHMIKTGPSFA